METVELNHFPIPLNIFVEEYDYIYNVRVNMYVRDREDPKKEILLTFTHNYFRDDFSRPEAIRHMLHYAMTHEIDECLLVDGKRIFDPHVNETI